MLEMTESTLHITLIRKVVGAMMRAREAERIVGLAEHR